MSFKPLTALRRGFGMFWRALDATRRTVLNLLFLLIVIAPDLAVLQRRRQAALAARPRWCSRCRATWSSSTAATLRDAVLANVGGDVQAHACSCATCSSVLDAAAQGPEHRQRRAAARRDRRAAAWPRCAKSARRSTASRRAGKTVVAWGGSYDQKRYLVASHASEVYRAPDGHGHDRRLRPPPQLLPRRARQAGRHGQPDESRHLQERRRAVHRQRPVEAAAEADAYLYNALWAGYTAHVEKNRKLPAGAIMQA